MTTTLADQFLNDTLDVLGEYRTTTFEVEVDACRHSAGCPCGGRLVNTVVGFYCFTDGSVYIEELGFERSFTDEDTMTDWLDTHEVALAVQDRYYNGE